MTPEHRAPRPSGPGRADRAARARAEARSARQVPVPARIVISLLLIIGALVTLWPIGRSAASAIAVEGVVRSYEASVEQTPSAELTKALAAAEAYNAALPANAFADPWGEVEAGSPEHDHYLALLDPDGDGIIGRVRVPTIGVDLPIRHDATWASMAHGAGHMYGTSLPVGGTGTHAVIAAHTGALTGTFFDRLPEVGVGDLIEIEVAGRALTYEVERTSVVLPDAIDEVRRDDGADLLTLVTCVDLQPDGTHAKRLLVRAHRVEASNTPSQSADSTTITRSAIDLAARVIPGYDPSMTLRLGIGVGALVLLAFFAITWAKDDRALARAREEAR